MKASNGNPPRRRFLHTRSEILFVAASVIWAAVMVDTGAVAWPLAVWLTTALIPFSLHRHRIDPAPSDFSEGTPT